MTIVPKKGFVIAIDGPAGTGKSSVTRRLCTELKFVHIDTGALYRAVGVLALERKILKPSDLGKGGAANEERDERIADLSRTIHFEFKLSESEDPPNRLFLNGVDVTSKLRTEEASLASSLVSCIPGVRAALLGFQRRLGCERNSILEGRDIGTVVFPDADLKVFLTASLDKRTERRLNEISESAPQSAPQFGDLRDAIAFRDSQDSTRKVAPLKKAHDAIEITTDDLDIQNVVAKIKALVLERLKSEA